MARFSVGGDEDGNEERPNNNRPLPKRPRISNPVLQTRKRRLPFAESTSNSTSTSTSGNPASISDVAQSPSDRVLPLEDPLAVEESEWESVGESDSDTSGSDSSSEEEQEQNQSGVEVLPTEPLVESAPNGNGSDGSGGSVSVTLTDTDVLDCPICFEPLSSPVYQCENGHIACSSCCTTMRNKCASCCWPIGYNRCRAIEKVLESVRVTCLNRRHGCMETLAYSKKLSHEKTCEYIPCSCPYLTCNYTGISKFLYMHVAQVHPTFSKYFLFNSVISLTLGDNQKHIFLLEKFSKVLFVLNRSVESLGSFVDVVCVGPNSNNVRFLYDVTVVVGESSIKLKTHAEFIPKWAPHHRSKLYLLVPNDVISVNGQLRMDLIIRNTPAITG